VLPGPLGHSRCLLELEHEFGHASRRLNNVPYVPGDDLPVLSDESIFEGVVSAYDAVRVPMSGNLHTDIPLKNTDMDMTTIAYSMKISNFFDFGVAGVLPGFLVADDAHVITPMWSKTGLLSLAVNDGETAREYDSMYKLKRNKWITVKICVNAGRNVKMWIDDDIVIDQRLSVDQVSGVAMYCQRFGGTSHSVVSFNTLQVWSGACGLVENLNIPGHDEL
jgi:hypothetical protein